jgi:hypothetical protein
MISLLSDLRTSTVGFRGTMHAASLQDALLAEGSLEGHTRWASRFRRGRRHGVKQVGKGSQTPGSAVNWHYTVSRAVDSSFFLVELLK